jgi:hypothetical protein
MTMPETPRWRKRLALAAVGAAWACEIGAVRAYRIAQRLAPAEFALAHRLAELDAELERMTEPPVDYERRTW